MDREHFSDDDSPLSNSTPHSEEDDKHSEDFARSPPAKYLDESPPHEDPDAYAQQQHELLERLKEQFSTFPFQNPVQYTGVGISKENKKIKPEAQNEFPFRFPTPPPSKEEIKISSSSKKNVVNHGWSYEDQFKQVRQLYEINDDPKRKEFLDDLFTFMKDRGTPINRLPIMAKSVLDLYELYKLVIARGGLVNVINKKLWQEIIKDLNLPSSITSAAFTLRTQYTKYLYPYECEKYNLSSESELQAAIENNKRDGSRRSTSNYNQFTPQSPQNPHHQQLQMAAMASTLATAATANVGLNLTGNNNNSQQNDLPSNHQQQLNEMQLAQQRFMMMMFLYNQMIQAQGQST
ncbi:protein dead ringer-like [Chironomus tepperi]|uniref:protein dead ringer-like n=1 Tax=Chironomus tepperi TaxID=113505 RepID=UPI00391FC80F